jgi:hypothetical protein
MKCPSCQLEGITSGDTCPRCGVRFPVAVGAAAAAAPAGQAPFASPLLFAPALLRLLDGETFLGRVSAGLLRALAALAAVGGVYAWIRSWGDLEGATGTDAFALVIFQVVTLGLLYTVAHVLWLRADDSAGAGGDGLAAIPVAAVWLRLGGELYAAACAFVGAGAALAVLVGGRSAGRTALGGLDGLFPFLPELGPNQLVAAVVLLVSFAVAGFLALLSGHAAAELLRRLGGGRR